MKRWESARTEFGQQVRDYTQEQEQTKSKCSCPSKTQNSHDMDSGSNCKSSGLFQDLD